MAEVKRNQIMEEFWGPVLGFMAAAIAMLATGIVALIIAALVFTALYSANANRLLIGFTAATGIITSFIIYKTIGVEFILYPMQMTGGIWSASGGGEPALKILLSPPPEFFSTFFSNYFKMIVNGHSWHHSTPLGFIMGSVAYGAYFNYFHNGITITKRTKDQLKSHKRVGSLAASKFV